jgi:tRNA threonylcarbamoyladenosine biosynthesis protein TsaE
MSGSFSAEVSDVGETMALGRRLGNLLFPGAVVSLVGQLGAGKTHFVRAIALGLGLKQERAVTSPTFVLVQEYQGRLPIYHFDAYRLHAEQEFHDLGAHEYFQGQGVCLIEWGDRVAGALPEELLQVTLTISGATARRFHFEARGAVYERIVSALETHAATPG